MSLAVAITNTGAVFSESQVKKVPKTREGVPPSLPADPWVPANALSISSIQRIAGATLSAVCRARRIDGLPMHIRVSRWSCKSLKIKMPGST